jgi:hypothetical protein
MTMRASRIVMARFVAGGRNTIVVALKLCLDLIVKSRLLDRYAAIAFGLIASFGGVRRCDTDRVLQLLQVRLA